MPTETTDADLVEQRQHTAHLLATGHCDNPLHQLKQMLEAAGARKVVPMLTPESFRVIEAWTDARRDAACQKQAMAEVATGLEIVSKLDAIISAREVEIVRLTEALERIAQVEDRRETETETTLYWIRLARWRRKVARAALEPAAAEGGV